MFSNPIRAIFAFGLFFYGVIFSQGSGVGINLGRVERGGTFVDLVQENYRWNSEGKALSAQQVDAKGWPTVDASYVYDARPVAEWSGSIDDPDVYRIDMSGTYKCRFSGKADVTATGGRVTSLMYDPATNVTTFDFVIQGPPGPGHGFFILTFKNTQREAASARGTGFTNFKMHRPGYPLDYPDPFTKNFIKAVRGINFECIRYMPFLEANSVDPVYPAVTEWKQRKTATDASQARIPQIGKLDGGAWEYVITLSNRLGVDPWINIPVSATEDYVNQLAKMFRDNLAPALHVYVESSNEVWNSIFPQQAYNKAQASALKLGEQENHARRTIELATIFQKVFGAGSLNKRVRVILPSHFPMRKWWVVPMIKYITDNHGKPSDFLWGISSQGYFSIPSKPNQTVAEILKEAKSNITKLISDPTKGDSEGESGRLEWANYAKSLGLSGGYLIYEGGSHPPLGELNNISNVISAERDPGMGELLKYNYKEAFFDVGGSLTMHFILSGAYTRYGSFGLTDDINTPERNSKYAALRELAGGPMDIQKPLRDNFTSSQWTLKSHSANSICLTQSVTPLTRQVSVRLTDARGNVIQSWRLTPEGEGRENTLHLRLSNARKLSPGLYLLTLRGKVIAPVVLGL